ncbi:hypothetical protein CHS0354_034249 [Potamilus streckersoni]|uniref:Uncharacterized protein n=1 Tax=Potamilus streckersoni TaxID=2493646 RepID=A0AAE0S6T5_9BIVA|nr:hypothetical protein CHS0354_034249 [Potamilus streckersoni]
MCLCLFTTMPFKRLRKACTSSNWKKSLLLLFSVILVNSMLMVWIEQVVWTTDRDSLCSTEINTLFRDYELCRITMQLERVPVREESNKPEEVDLRIIVIVYNRAQSLLRLLESLNSAHYFGDRVAIHVWIDRSRTGMIDAETYRVAKRFIFRHGRYYIHNQTCHVGIYGQWMGTWNPHNGSSEKAVILEDDISVSPYFYKWLKLVYKKYSHRDDINGYALQGVSMKHGKFSNGLIEVDTKHKTFLFPILGTWGFSPKVKHWSQFLEWYRDSLKDPEFQPIIPGILPSRWWSEFTEKGKIDGMWEMWHIYHAWINRYYTLYNNYEGLISMRVW